MYIQIASIFGGACAVYGSFLFSKRAFRVGSMMFMLGNVTNIMVGLAIGNLSLALAQLALCAFAITMYQDGLFNLALVLYGGILANILGVAPHQHFRMPPLDSAGTILATYGAYCMSQKEYETMTLMWVIADIIFIVVAYNEGLWGLLVQSIIFTHHGFERLVRHPYHES